MFRRVHVGGAVRTRTEATARPGVQHLQPVHRERGRGVGRGGLASGRYSSSGPARPGAERRLIGRHGTPLTDEIVIADESGVPRRSPTTRRFTNTSSSGARRVRRRFARRESVLPGRGSAASSPPGRWRATDPSVACSSRSGACLVVAAGFGIQARLIGPEGVPAGPRDDARGRRRADHEGAPNDGSRICARGRSVSGRVATTSAIDGADGGPAGSPMGEFCGSPADPARARLQPWRPGVRRHLRTTRKRGRSRLREPGEQGRRWRRARAGMARHEPRVRLARRSYLAAWTDEEAPVVGLPERGLVPIAPADFAGGSVVTYNAAADEYLLVRPSCTQPGNLQAVCGRRVGNPPAAADRTGPRLRLTLRRLQRVVRQHGLVLRARCDEACTVRLSARIALPGASRSVVLRADQADGGQCQDETEAKTSKRTLGKLRRSLKARIASACA